MSLYTAFLVDGWPRPRFIPLAPATVLAGTGVKFYRHSSHSNMLAIADGLHRRAEAGLLLHAAVWKEIEALI